MTGGEMKGKKQSITLLCWILILTSLAISGCGSSIGLYPHMAETQTQLSNSNFKIIQTGVTGYSRCWYIMNTIPIGDLNLYEHAMNDIRNQVQPVGRSISLINITQDRSVVTYLVVSKVALTLTADVVEFVD